MHGAAHDNDNASVVIIGMRGSGKSFIGELAASALGWTCIDADHYFEEKYPQGVRAFVQEKGWPAFREAETAILLELLGERSTNHVISLGGGIVETESAREVLKAYRTKGPVVHIKREIEDVVRYLEKETERPAYGEKVVDVFLRREPWFLECCNFEFMNQVGRPEDGNIKLEIDRFFKHITGLHPNLAENLAPGKRSYFLSLTFPDIIPALENVDEITAGVDAIELRVDLLRAPKDHDASGVYFPPLKYVADQVSALRRRSPLPIVYTIRTFSQGGAFPDGAVPQARDLIDLGMRLGVEYVDCEITWPEKNIRELTARKGASKVIASWHDWSGRFEWDSALAKEKFALADRFGDIIKIVGKANSLEDNFKLHDFVKKHSEGPNAKPIIAINMGVDGQMSRILNETFSPVTHPLLPVKAAPGQLSFAQIQSALHLLGKIPAQKYYLFGNPIGHSLSPTLHNTAFGLLGLPHTYEAFQTYAVTEQLKQRIRAPEFGGASVTIPFKRDILALLDETSAHAKAIGAVNTIIPRTKADGTRVLFGENTDWLGIRDVVLAKLPAHIPEIDAALVVGAGGTSRAAIYALHTLGAKHIYLYNRTRAAAEELVTAFPNVKLELVDTLGAYPGPAPVVVVGTIPATATATEKDVAGHLYIPETVFASERGGLVVDMAYKPADTPLLQQARKAEGWVTVQGVEVLLEQAYEQFVRWTGRHVPRAPVAKAVWAKYNA